MQIEYSNFRTPGFERRSLTDLGCPEHLITTVQKRNIEARKRKLQTAVPVVPELTTAEQDELRARTAAVIAL